MVSFVRDKWVACVVRSPLCCDCSSLSLKSRHLEQTKISEMGHGVDIPYLCVTNKLLQKEKYTLKND
jgi:hypothetical protein